MASSSTMLSGRRVLLSILATLLLLAATFVVYYPVHYHPFFNVDDSLYVTSNPHVLGPLNASNLGWAFTHAYCLNYDPITFVAHSVNVGLFHLDPRGHHDANVVLHGLNAILLFWVLKRATGYTGRSFMVAALFALHPINVENVAWISELKTLLSTTFFFLALGAYQWYAERPGLSRMAVVSLLYGLGLLAKPQIIILPLLLVLWDYWPLERIGNREWRSLLLEKIPLFAIAFVDAVLTIFAEHQNSPAGWPYSLNIRVGNAVLCYSRYIGKLLWPVHLGYLYPHPGYGLRWSLVFLSGVLLAAVTAGVIILRKRRYLPVAWFWFLIALIPMLGLVPIDTPPMADRWAYASEIGIFILVCWSVGEWADGHRLRAGFSRIAGALALVALALVTRHQIAYWADDLTLWKHSVEISGRNWMAERMVGILLEARGQNQEALGHYYRAAEESPGDAAVNLGIARAEGHLQHLARAADYYNRVLVIAHDDKIRMQAWAGLAQIYNEQGNTAAARQAFQEARRLYALQEHPPADTGID